MQHRVSRGTHGNIERHGIQEGSAGGDATGKNRFVAILIVGKGILHNQFGSITEQLYTIDVRSQNTAVARQREAKCFRQRVHGVGSEHTRASTATGTCAMLHHLQFLVAHRGVATFNHSRNQVGILAVHFTSLHGTATDKDGGDIQSHGSHQHARRHLVTV